MTEARVVVLSSWGNPQLPEALAALALAAVPVHAVVCAGRIGARDLDIIRSRTTGHLHERDLFNLQLSESAFHFVRGHNGEDCLAVLAGLEPALLLNAGTPDILSARTLASARIGAISSHPGLLPEYRGATCVEWALYNDNPVGASCFFMDEGLDTGPVIVSEAMRVDAGTTYEGVRARMMRHECRLLACAARRSIDEGLVPARMPPQGEGRRHYVIGTDALAEVRRKLAAGEYRCDGAEVSP